VREGLVWAGLFPSVVALLHLPRASAMRGSPGLCLSTIEEPQAEWFTPAKRGDSPNRMDALRPFTFRFDSDTEVHYLARAPEVGERVTHSSELWVVAEVRSDAAGEVVFCERSSRTRNGNGSAVEAHAAGR
jgi:hypothetical protein